MRARPKVRCRDLMPTPLQRLDRVGKSERFALHGASKLSASESMSLAKTSVPIQASHARYARRQGSEGDPGDSGRCSVPRMRSPARLNEGIYTMAHKWRSLRHLQLRSRRPHPPRHVPCGRGRFIEERGL